MAPRGPTSGRQRWAHRGAWLRAGGRSGCSPIVWVLVDLAQADREHRPACRPSGSRGRPRSRTTTRCSSSCSRTARIGRAFVNSTSSSPARGGGPDHQRDGRLSARTHALPRPRPRLRGAGRQPDDPERGAAGAAVRARPAARLAQHLPGADRPRGGDDVRVRRLPAAPVLPDDAARARGRRPDRRRRPLAGLHPDRAAALAAGARPRSRSSPSARRGTTSCGRSSR